MGIPGEEPDDVGMGVPGEEPDEGTGIPGEEPEEESGVPGEEPPSEEPRGEPGSLPASRLARSVRSCVALPDPTRS